MPYDNRIKTLEESIRLIETQINTIEKADAVDHTKLSNLNEYRNKYITQLRDLRKAQYEETQSVDYSDDH